MTDREKTMEFLEEYLKDFSKPNGAIAKHMLQSMENNITTEPVHIIKALFRVLDECKKDNTSYIPPIPIQISADTEEGKRLIKNLIEMQNKK